MNKIYRSLGEDVFISDRAIIKRPEICNIGSHVAIDNEVTISTRISIGDYVHIAPSVIIIGGADSSLVLDHFSFLGAGTKVVCGSEDFSGLGLIGPTIPKEYREIKYTTIKIEKYAGSGVNCTIMPGVTMAEGSVLGANSLLTKDTKPWTVYVGSPARPVSLRRKDIIIEHAKKLGYEF